jgi:hypothetical protein
MGFEQPYKERDAIAHQRQYTQSSSVLLLLLLTA